jgi:hypothetical protein
MQMISTSASEVAQEAEHQAQDVPAPDSSSATNSGVSMTQPHTWPKGLQTPSQRPKTRHGPKPRYCGPQAAQSTFLASSGSMAGFGAEPLSPGQASACSGGERMMDMCTREELRQRLDHASELIDQIVDATGKMQAVVATSGGEPAQGEATDGGPACDRQQQEKPPDGGAQPRHMQTGRLLSPSPSPEPRASEAGRSSPSLRHSAFRTDIWTSPTDVGYKQHVGDAAQPYAGHSSEDERALEGSESMQARMADLEASLASVRNVQAQVRAVSVTKALCTVPSHYAIYHKLPVRLGRCG